MTVDRYTTSEMLQLWSKEAELERLCKAAEASAYLTGGAGLHQAVKDICGTDAVNCVAWADYEDRFDHDIAAFVEMIRAALPGGMRDSWHRRRTSSDLVDTALALAIRDASAAIYQAKYDLARELARVALDFRTAPVMGRTHGQFAEPTTIGRKFALFAYALHDWEPGSVAYGKMSGPVGTDSFPGDASIMIQLGLDIVPSTQIVPRWYLAEFVLGLVPLANIVSSLATEIRLGSQSGISWVREGRRTADARGSSAMPQKRNPIRSERAVGLAKVIRHNAYAVADSGAELWNERDISHSSVERTALVDAISLTHFLLRDMTDVTRRLEFDLDDAAAGCDEATGVGAVEALVRSGVPYSAAYDHVRAVGPAEACRQRGVDGRGFGYDPDLEPELWDTIRNLVG